MTPTTFTVSEQDAGSRLDRWCVRHLGGAASVAYQKALRKGLIRLNGKKAEGASRVAAGDVVALRLPLSAFAPTADATRRTAPRAASREDAAAITAWVLYRDDHLIVLNKPPGLAVQGGSGVAKHLDGMLPALRFGAKSNPHLVHRLDKDTSGVLLLARHPAAARALQQAFTAKLIGKTYLALVAGVPKPRAGEIVSNLDKLARGAQSRELVMSVDEAGKRAVTIYRTREHLAKSLALVELEPVTGRTHQLRVHMAEHGCPIVGDGKYGGKAAHPGGTLALSGKLHLHAWRITLPPLFDQPQRQFDAPLPPHFAASLSALGIVL